MTRRITHTILLAIFLAHSTQSVAVDATWNGGVGDWSDGGFWTFDPSTAAAFPSNGSDTFDVFIDGSNLTNSIVTLNVNPTIDSLEIDTGDQLIIGINQILSVNNSIVNNGTISINDNNTGFVTDLRINDTVTYSGSGVFSNTAITSNRLVGIGADPILINQSSLVLESGFMEINALTIDNQGSIQANAGATIQISANSLIDGGLITTTGDGVVEAASGANVNDVNIGSLTVISGRTLNASGDLTISGALELRDTNSGFFTNLFLNDTVNYLGGGGAITTTNTLENRIAGNGGAVLNINGELKITGEDATPGGLRIDLDTVNNNSLLLADNATVLLESSDINNTNGIVEARNGSTIQFGSALDFSGGFLKSDAGSFFQKIGGFSILRDVTLDSGSRLEIQSNQQLDVAGALTNNGTIHLDDSSAGFFTTLMINQPVIYAGTGEFTASSSFENRITGLDASASLTNTTDFKLNAGNLIISSLGVINQGSFLADNGSTLRLQSITMDNSSATIEALNGSTVEFNNGTELTGGTLHSDSGSQFSVLGGGASMFTDVSLASDSQLNVTSNNVLNLKNSFVNDGLVHLDDQSAGFTTEIKVDGAVNYSGAGSITATETFENRISGLDRATAQLNNADTLSLDGGSLLMRALDITNQGTIQSDNGAQLRLEDTIIDNTGGIIGARNGSTTELSFSVEVLNGEITTENNGLVKIVNSTSFDNVTLTNGSALEIANNQALTVKTALVNNGNILFNDQTAGFLTQLEIEGNVDYSGSGTISASDSFENRLTDVGVDAVFNNNTNLLVDSGQLRISGLDINNQGSITAGAGSTVHLQAGTHITGGTITTIGDGILRTDTSGSGLILEDVTIGTGGIFTVDNNLGFEVRGNLGLDGNISQLDSDSSFTTRVELEGDVVFLGGTGAFTPSDNTANELFGNTGSTLDIQNDLRVIGGALGFRNLDATNGATILADGADILMRNTDISQTEGRIEAVNDSKILLSSNVLIDGGILDTDATSLAETQSTSSVTLRDVSLTEGSRLIINNNDRVNLENSFTNEGTVTLDDTNTSFTTQIFAANDVTLLGEGVFVNSANTANRFSGAGTAIVTVGDQLVLAGGNMFFNAAILDNMGIVAADNGAFLDIHSSTNIVNLLGTTLTGGTWRAKGAGSILELSNHTINANSAEIILSEAGSVLRGTQIIEETLSNNNADGVLRVLSDRDYTTNLNFINDGVVELGGGVFSSNSFANNATAEIFGFGTVSPVLANSGLVRATGGTLTASAGIDGQSGTIQIDPDGKLVIGANSDGDFLTHNGNASDSLDLQTFDITVDEDYTNANFGVGNNFDARTNIIGSGQILASGDVSQTLSGEISDGSSANATVDFGNVHVGDFNTRTYQINNDGTNGPALRGALQTNVNGGNIDDARLGGTGATASNFGPIATGNDSGDLTIEFDATDAGALTGQVVHIENNFDNVAGQDISITGAAYRFANPDITPNPIELSNVHVNDVSEQVLTVLNDVPDDGFSEALNASFAANTGDAVNNNGTINLLGPSSTDNTSLIAGINTATAGEKSGTVTLDLVSDGTGSSELGLTTLAQQIINISGNVYRFADADVSPSPVVIGNVHVGQSAQQSLTVANVATADSFSESLNASFAANTGNAINNGGTINLLAAGANDSTSLVAGIDASSAGAKSGTITVDLISDGSGTSDLGQTALLSQTIAVSGNVYRFADANISPQPVSLANVHINDVSEQTLNVTNQVATDGFSESLNANLGATSGDATSNNGSFSALAAGGTDNSSLVVGIDTSTVGAKLGSVAVNLASNGDGISNLGQTALTTQNVTVSGNVFGFAEADIDQTTLDFVMRRGDAPVQKVVGISNIAVNDGFHEGLDTSVQSLASGYSISGGESTNLAAGSSTSATLSLTGATSGVFDGEVQFNLGSNGTISGLSNTALAGQSVNLTGRVYETAVADVQTNSLDFGIVHVGDLIAAKNIAVANAASGALNDKLIGSVATTPTGFSGNGDLGTGIEAGDSDTSSLTISLDTSAAGIFSGDAVINFASTNSELSDVSLANESVSLFGQVNNFANPDVSKLSGDGAFSLISPTLLELDFGNLEIGSGGVQAELSILNDVVGPADSLRGEFDLGSPLAGFVGFEAFTNIGAGESQNGLAISFDPLTLGSLNDLVTIELFGFNASGFEQALAPIQLVVKANVVAPVPLPAPVWMLLSGVLLLIRKRRAIR